MTFRELNKRLIVKQKPEDWTQSAAGGWIHKHAKVEDSNNVRDNAIVWGTVKGAAVVSDNARIEANSKVCGWAIVTGNARICGRAQIFDNAVVEGDACVCDDARIFENAVVNESAVIADQASVYGWAQIRGQAYITESAKVHGQAACADRVEVRGTAEICGNAQVCGRTYLTGGFWFQTPLFIAGSKYNVSNCAPGYIKIGCKTYSFDQWLKQGKKIAINQGFTYAQIAEYREYVKLIKRIGK